MKRTISQSVMLAALATLLGLVFAPRHAHAQEALPPILLTPYNESDVAERFVTWSWFMQPRLPSGEEVVCDLIVVEVLPGQTPEEAFRANPSVIVKEDLRSSAWQASLATRSFQSDHHYAWRIVARGGGKVVSESEIWVFTHADPDLENEKDYEKATAGEEAPRVPDQQTSSPKQSPAGVIWTTKSRLTVESSNRPGELSKLPQEFGRLEIDPTINVNGAPLQLGILLTTERNEEESSINRGTFNYQRDLAGLGLNVEQRVAEKVEEIRQTKLDLMRDTLRIFMGDSSEFDRQIEELNTLKVIDPVEAIRNLNQFEGGTESFLLDIPAFGFGAVAPRFTDLTLNGVTLNGGFVEYNPGNLFFSLALGKTQRQIDLSGVSTEVLGEDASTTPPTFFRNLYATRLGYGKKDGDNVIISLMHAQDDDQSRILERLLDTSSTSFGFQEHFLLGVAGRIGVEPLDLSLDGEMNISLFNDAVQTNVPSEQRLSGLVTRIFNGNNVRGESFGDIAYALRTRKLLFDRQARATAGMRMVGPSYRTVGVADLRTDVFGYDIGYEHNLIRNLLTAGLTFGVEKSGFVVKQPNTATLTTAGVTADIRRRNMPAVHIAYTRNKQEQTTIIDSVPTTRASQVEQLTLSSQHLVRIGSTRLGISLSYSQQEGTSEDGLTDFTSRNFAVSNRLSLSSPLSFAFTFSSTRTKSVADTVSIPASVSVDFSVLHKLFGAWQNVAGTTYATNQSSRARGIYLSSGAEFHGFGSVELRWEYNEFTSSAADVPGFIDKVLRVVTTLQL